ncbi:phage protein Gp35 domain-containing protein [Streptomyces sp. NPDC093509]|uniref:phage protein Gp35 domain-containing protein n=1 Tax=Streptomyces sp. NPDC093509 TaxID=3154982 RepID=UPI003450A8C1
MGNHYAAPSGRPVGAGPLVPDTDLGGHPPRAHLPAGGDGRPTRPVRLSDRHRRRRLGIIPFSAQLRRSPVTGGSLAPPVGERGQVWQVIC